MRRRQKFLDPLGAPLDRPLEFARAPRDHGVLGIQAGLHAEAAANVADHDAHFFQRDPQHFAGERVAKAGRHLAAGDHG